MFAEFVNNIVNSEDIVMKSDGSAVRAFCYIADATDAFFRILKDGDPGTAYNMCNSGCRISVAELAQTLVSLFPEKELKVRRVERAQNSSYMESPVKVVTKISTERLESLGWKPKYDIKAGFGRTINSFVQE
jgi:nucleoside-diphosphate-sugar epimerase